MPATQVVAGAFTAIILFAATLPWLRARFRTTDPELVNLVSWALAAKLLASIARYFVAYQIYGGVADAQQYIHAGEQLVKPYRSFHFSHLYVGKVIGTGFVKILTGLVFAYTGVSEIGGFFIFSWLGFLGLWLLFRAFRIAFPEGNARRYAWLVFLLPSMLFWPSEIGKEAWMTLGLGITAYGAARVLVRMRWGYTFVVSGSAATAMVRPHVTVLFLAGFFPAFLLRKEAPGAEAAGSLPGRTRRFGGKKVIGVILLIGAMLVAVTQANKFFSSDSLENGSGAGSITSILNGTAARTSQGGSQFAPASLTHPWGIPYAVLSVTFRPWPWEARNVQSFLASAEGAFLLYLLWRSRKKLRNLPRWMVARPYLLLCVVYAVLFAFAFSAVGNFGILARERVMQFPFFVAILALPDYRPGEAPGEQRDERLNAPANGSGRRDVLALASAPLARSPLPAPEALVARKQSAHSDAGTYTGSPLHLGANCVDPPPV